MQIIPLTTVGDDEAVETSQEIAPANKSEMIDENPFENPIANDFSKKNRRKKD